VESIKICPYLLQFNYKNLQSFLDENGELMKLINKLILYSSTVNIKQQKKTDNGIIVMEIIMLVCNICRC